jgi:ATP-dependent Clp protease ATP-binding subunit ClpA
MASEIVFPIGLIYRKVGPGTVLAEALFYPELSRVGVNRNAAGEALRKNLVEAIPRLKPEELLRRRRAAAASELTFTLLLEPPRLNEAWRAPIELTFHAVVWRHPRPNQQRASRASPTAPGNANAENASDLVLARIVELDIEVIAETSDNLTAVLRREALSALRRTNLSVGLRTLARVQTTQAFELEWTNLQVKTPTLKDRALRADQSGDEKRTLLQKLATQFRGTEEPAYEIEETVEEIDKALTANPPQSVLLIGPSGVGKSAAVRQLARSWSRNAGKPAVFHTSGARIVAGQTGFGMWEQRCQDLIKEVSKKRVVLHMGALLELMEVGKSEYNHSGIATFLRPAIARGDLLAVAEATPEQLPLIEKQDPQLLDAFRHIVLDEPNDARGRAILAEFARDYPVRAAMRLAEQAALSSRKKRRAQRRRERNLAEAAPATSPQHREATAAALAAIDRLHRRYATYSAYPGRPLRFLENLLRDAAAATAGSAVDSAPPPPIVEDEVYRAFTRETGLPRSIIDPAVALDIAAMHQWFSARVIGQEGAVNLVVDLLATVKAGLTRPNRPIASLLFIGPTGVGKTEMAKALAEFLFGSQERLTRFDMSEFGDPVSIRRLVGGAFGSEGLLTARVREQPFSVLLLDEVEKADASFFDLLLQALGEARLTDAGGRLADFRNTVVILTSNLGAESFRQGAAGFNAGGAVAKAQANEHFARAVEQFLRPEMFNRIDRIVPFSLLDSGTIRRIADREWHKVLQRDGVRFREIGLTTAPDLLDHLAAIGFDARYGARPLKRAMDRELLAPLARQMNRHPGDTPLTVAVGIEQGKPDVQVRPVQGARARSGRELTSPAGKLAADAQQMRRWHQLASTCSTMRELNNEVYQLTQMEQAVYRKQRLGKKLMQLDNQALVRLGRLREVQEEAIRQRQAAEALEDAAVIAFHDGLEPSPDLTLRLTETQRDWDRLLLRLYALNAPASDSVTLALFAENPVHRTELAAAYRQVALAQGLSMRVVRYDLPQAGKALPPAAELDAPQAPGEAENPPSTRETKVPATAWKDNGLYATNPLKLLLVRKEVDASRQEDYSSDETLGVALAITGGGAHVRFWGEAGVHDIHSSDQRSGVNPGVLAFVSAENVLAYRPPEAVIRRGLLKDREIRREYNIVTGTMRDRLLERSWTNLHGHLWNWVEPAIAANMRLRLMRMLGE